MRLCAASYLETTDPNRRNPSDKQGYNVVRYIDYDATNVESRPILLAKHPSTFCRQTIFMFRFGLSTKRKPFL